MKIFKILAIILALYVGAFFISLFTLKGGGEFGGLWIALIFYPLLFINEEMSLISGHVPNLVLFVTTGIVFGLLVFLYFVLQKFGKKINKILLLFVAVIFWFAALTVIQIIFYGQDSTGAASLAQTAIEKNDLTICERKIKDSDKNKQKFARAECLTAAAKITGDKKICQKISTAEDTRQKDYCEKEIDAAYEIINANCGKKEVYDQQCLEKVCGLDYLKTSLEWCRQTIPAATAAANGGKNTIPYAFPNEFDKEEGVWPRFVSSSYIHVLSMPFHDTKKILRVYADWFPASLNPKLPFGRFTQELVLSVFDSASQEHTAIGTIHPVSYTGNSTGIFVPFGISKDDRLILLNALMADPGVGGGLVDYGFASIPVKPAPRPNYVIPNFTFIATREARFYDSLTKVVYVTEGENTPRYSKPGPANNAVIMLRDLANNRAEVILAERDTSYSLVEVDEKNGQLSFSASKYTFAEACPRQENALSCAFSTITKRTTPLPGGVK